MIAVFSLLFVLFGSGCRSVSPKLQDEYIRPGLSQGICNVFNEHRQSIPNVMKEHKIPGLSIAVVDREGILWIAGFGSCDSGSWRKQPVTRDTLFSIQSMSKTFTSLGVMMAVRDGLVDLDAPVTRYLPDFRVNSRFEENPQDRITLRHLLTHSSGLSQAAPMGNVVDIRSPSFTAHVESISETWLLFNVGERYKYSNQGIDLAAYILQVVSGQSFVDYMKEKVFDPLGMPNSSMDSDYISQHPNRAIGHMPYVRESPTDIPMLGAGGVYTSVNELSRFVRFFLNRGKIGDRTLLAETFIDEIYTPVTINKNYGLGINRGQNHGTHTLWHLGGGFGFQSTMDWYPEYGLGCMVLTNSMSLAGLVGGTEHVKLSDAILGELIEDKLVEKTTHPPLPRPKQLAEHASQPPILKVVDPNTFTPYRPEWKQYTGAYTFRPGGYKLKFIFGIFLAIGYFPPEIQIRVYEKDGYLYMDEQQYGKERLDEHLPGLFFTKHGECLDFRSSTPRYMNMRVKKIR